MSDILYRAHQTINCLIDSLLVIGLDDTQPVVLCAWENQVGVSLHPDDHCKAGS